MEFFMNVSGAYKSCRRYAHQIKAITASLNKAWRPEYSIWKKGFVMLADAFFIKRANIGSFYSIFTFSFLFLSDSLELK